MTTLASEKPQTGPPSLLSPHERARCVERGLLGLYRWYVAKSQASRNWNPDSSFDWGRLRKDHSDEVHSILEGFYAVEQYVPDYVRTLLQVIRQSYGRSHFHMRWGAEEERHADLWRNAVLSLGRRTPEWMEDYTDLLREQRFALPWDDALHMVFYTLFQERATEVNYLNLAAAAEGNPRHTALAGATDSVLASACRTIARDEAAHYHFFLEASRLFLYYYPQESLVAMVDVLRHFSMPARHIIPDYDAFGAVLHATGVFTRRIHYCDVVKVALNHLGVADVRAVEAGIRTSREVPGPDGGVRETAIFESIDPELLESSVRRLFARIEQYARDSGVEHTMRTEFQPIRVRSTSRGLRHQSMDFGTPGTSQAPATLLSAERGIRMAFDRCDSRLSPGRAAEAIAELVSDLAEVRAATAPAAWRVGVEANRTHSVHFSLRQDPYIKAAYCKPRGYAGDAETLDFVYQRIHSGETSALGEELFQISTGAAIADAVRTRCEYLADRIQATARRGPKATLVSVACGHMRELHRLGGALLAGMQVVGVDHDEQTIARLAGLHPEVSLLPIRASIKDVLQQRLTLPPADLCYAAGLYDYLDDRLAAALAKRLVTWLQPGGALLITNLTLANPEIAFMEAVMDWWMVYRGESALGALMQSVTARGHAFTCETGLFATGRVAATVLRRD